MFGLIAGFFEGKPESIIMMVMDPIFTVEFQMQEAPEFHFPQIGKKEASERALEMLHKVNIPRP